MPYTPPSPNDLIGRINARLGLGVNDETGRPEYVDPVTQPGFRVKTGEELPSYTRESRLAEENRLAGEYRRAGNSGRTWMTAGSEMLASPIAGVGQGLYTAVGSVVDPIAAATGFGRPVARDLVNQEYTYNAAGENPVAGFLRNVVKSVTSNVLAARFGGIGGVAYVNAVPTAMQEYERGMDAGLTPMQSTARATAYGIVAGAVSPIIERIAPGITAGVTGGFAKAIADDIGQPLATTMFRRLAKTAASEGAEESIQEIANQFIDAATADLTKNKDIEKPYATYGERMLDVAKAFGLGAAGGTLVQGGFDLMARMPSTARFIQENAAQLNQPIPPQPVQPTPEAMPQPEVANMPPVPIPGQETPNVPQAPSETLPVQPPGEVPETPVTAGPMENAPTSVMPDIQADPNVPPEVKVAAGTIRPFLDGLDPEIKQVIAELPVTSRKEFAATLGVEPNQLPDAVKTDRGRRAAQVMAQRDLQQPQQVDAEQPQYERMAFTNITGDTQKEIRSFISSLKPDERQAIASMPNATIEQYAKALSVPVGNLPPAFKSDAVRIAIKTLVRRQVDKQPKNPMQYGRTAPGPDSTFAPTGAEAPNMPMVPRATNPNFSGPPSQDTANIEEINASLTAFAQQVSGFKTPVSEGVKQSSDGYTYGFYDPKTGSVRLANRNSIPAAAHELAHMMDRTTPIFRTAPQSATKEMYDIGETMGQAYDPGDYVPEGRAEFMRAYIQEGPQAAQALAPEMFKHFTGVVQQNSPRALEALNQTAEKFNTLVRGMNAEQRIRDRIVQPGERPSALMQAISSPGEMVRAISREMVNIAEVDNEIAKQYREYRKAVTGKDEELPDYKRPGKIYMLRYQKAAHHMKQMVMKGMINVSGEFTGGKGLVDVLAPAEGQPQVINDFEVYLVAKRTLAIGSAIELEKFNSEMREKFGDEWADILPRSGPVTKRDAREAIDTLTAKYPFFEQMANDFYEWNDGVLAYMAQASPTLAFAVGVIKTRDPGFFFPFGRVIDNNGVANSVAKAQSGQIGRRLKGSNRPLAGALSQVIQNVESKLTTASQRMVLDSIIALADDTKGGVKGMARFIEKLDDGTKPDGPVWNVVVEGKVVRYQINDPGIMTMMEGLNPTSLWNIPVAGPVLWALFEKPGQVVKTFATQLRLAFAIAVQPIFNIGELTSKGAVWSDKYKSRQAKSIFDATVKRFTNQADLLYNWLTLWATRNYQQLAGAAGLDVSSDNVSSYPIIGPILANRLRWLERAEREGIEFATSYRNDDIASYNLSREAAGLSPLQLIKEDGAMAVLRWATSTLPRWLGDTINASEYAAKAAVLKAYIEGNNLTVDSRMSLPQQVGAAEATQEAFGNYGFRGRSARYMEKAFPYSSVPLIHVRSFIRAFQKDPAAMLQAGIPLLAASFLLALRNLDDEEYREADPAQKMRYVHIPMPDGSWRLAAAYSEFMTIFHGLGVLLAHAYYGKAGDQGFPLAWTGATNLLPSFSAPVITAVNEWKSGTDARTGRFIVPNYKDRREGDVQATVVSQRPATEQYTDRTSRIAVGLGWATGLSPMKVEKAIDTFTARWFTDIEKVFRGERAPSSLVTPRRKEAGLLSDKDQATTDLYAEIKKANERKNDPREAETPEHREQRLMLESADSARDAYSALMRREKDQEKVNAYSRIQRGLSRLAVTMYRKGEYSHSPFKVAKRVADVEAARLDQEPAEMAKLVYNGLDGLAFGKPLKAEKGKTLKELDDAYKAKRDEAIAFKNALGMSRDEALAAVRSHMIATKTPPKVMAYRMAAIAAAYK